MATPHIEPQFQVCQIHFEDCLPVWNIKLWPNRESRVETHSAMLHLSERHDMGNFDLPAWFYGAYFGTKLVAVNSGHMCTDGSARSRGLWVDTEHRGRHLATRLLTKTIDHARRKSARSIWSMPRLTAWPVYQSAGFVLTSPWSPSETSVSNAFCNLVLLPHDVRSQRRSD